MRNSKWALPLCTVFVVGLVGCANNNTAENQNPIDETGYHTTEKNALVRKIDVKTPMHNMGENLYGKDDAYSKRDRNYHGHESKPIQAKSSYYNSYEGDLVDQVDKIANRVDYVIDARAIVMKDEMLVALLLDDYDQSTAVKEEVWNQVKSLTEGRKLYVTTDEGVYYRTMTLDNNLRDGDTKELIVLDANDMFDNLDIHEDHIR